jgi:phosphomevalonate kinase
VPFRARAPGKLVVLGEYLVLSGAPALVMAVDRRCVACAAPSADARCHLETRAPASRAHTFAPGAASGVPLVDLVLAEAPEAARRLAFSGSIDSSAFFAGGHKIGLGSSAAALVAWAGVWTAQARASGFEDVPTPSLERLVEVHRAFQGGAGSGLDVAASFTGGLLSFELDACRMPQIGSVPVPNSVGFAGIFAGSPASTPDLVAHYHAWESAKPAQAAELKRAMGRTAELGRRAAREGNVDEFLAAVAEYGSGLDSLGKAMGAEIVTAEHRRIAGVAADFGVVYKTSGAGGGDVGLALTTRHDDLTAFKQAVAHMGFQVVDLTIASQGLVIEELTE